MNPDPNFGSKQKSPSPPLVEVPPRHEVRGASVHELATQSWLQTDVAPHVMQMWPAAQGCMQAAE